MKKVKLQFNFETKEHDKNINKLLRNKAKSLVFRNLELTFREFDATLLFVYLFVSVY